MAVTSDVNVCSVGGTGDEDADRARGGDSGGRRSRFAAVLFDAVAAVDACA